MGSTPSTDAKTKMKNIIQLEKKTMNKAGRKKITWLEPNTPIILEHDVKMGENLLSQGAIGYIKQQLKIDQSCLCNFNNQDVWLLREDIKVK